jgi:hypothetical protein
VRPTVFLEGFFLLLAVAGVRASDELALPMGGGKTSPISAVDVARAVAAILDDPAPHIGQIYDLTGPESADLDHYARVFSEALGRPIRYRDVPLPAWSESLRQAGLPEHLVSHLSAMAELTKFQPNNLPAATLCIRSGAKRSRRPNGDHSVGHWIVGKANISARVAPFRFMSTRPSLIAGQGRPHHPACVAGLRVKSTPLTTMPHSRPMAGETKRE